jgi:hypothetical protein
MFLPASRRGHAKTNCFDGEINGAKARRSRRAALSTKVAFHD